MASAPSPPPAPLAPRGAPFGKPPPNPVLINGCNTRAPEALPPVRYAINSSAWGSSQRVIEPDIDAAISHARSEIEASLTHEGDTVILTISAHRMTDAQIEAIPEWDGP